MKLLKVKQYRLVFILGLLLVSAVFISTNAHAHEGRPLFLELEQLKAAEIKLSWRLPPPLQAANAPKLVVQNTATKRVCQTSNSSPQLGPRPLGNRLFYCSRQSATADSFDFSTLNIRLDYPPTIFSGPVLVRLRAADGTVKSKFFDGSEPSLALDFYSNSATHSLVSYLKQGLLHIAGGYDHLLFVACLIFIAGSFRRILVTISGFTLAHSITLGLASFGLVQVPITAIETCIALSIAFLAAEIVKRNHSTLTWRHPALVAILFGLLHGFGFASALGEIGLPTNEKIPALLMFNLGVELGQIIFVLMFLPLMFLLKKMTTSASKWTGYAVGSVAMIWTLQRLLA